MRRVIAALIVVGLAVGVVLLWPRATTDDTPATLAGPSTTTSTSTSAPPSSTTTAAPTSTTTTSDSHVVETVEEAEAILRELWFGWFEGIYNEDEDRIREVVATEQMLNAALNAFGSEFESAPAADQVEIDIEILRTDEECLVTWGLLDVTAFRGPDATTRNVQVLRHTDGHWKFATSWVNPQDLWETDCESELQPLP